MFRFLLGSFPCRLGQVYGISDLHADFEDNLKWLRELPATEYQNDVLCVAGDISDHVSTHTRAHTRAHTHTHTHACNQMHLSDVDIQSRNRISWVATGEEFMGKTTVDLSSRPKQVGPF